MTATATAQKAGRCNSETCSSEGMSVTPITSPFSSLTGLGVVIKLTTIVTSTQTSQDHSPRYIFSAISLAWLESATYLSAEGSSLTQAHMLMDETVPASSPQNPPAAVARFHSIPRITVPN